MTQSLRRTGVTGVDDELVVDMGLALLQSTAVDADFPGVSDIRLTDVDLERRAGHVLSGVLFDHGHHVLANFSGREADACTTQEKV